MKKAPRKETLTCRSECKGSMVGCSEKHRLQGSEGGCTGQRGKVATEDLAKSLILIRVLGFVPLSTGHNSLGKAVFQLRTNPGERLSYQLTIVL